MPTRLKKYIFSVYIHELKAPARQIHVEYACENRYTNCVVAAGFPVFVGVRCTFPYIRRDGAWNHRRGRCGPLYGLAEKIISEDMGVFKCFLKFLTTCVILGGIAVRSAVSR